MEDVQHNHTINSVIQGLGHYVPEKVLSNYDLSKMMDTSHEWIVERSGIETRRIAAPGTSTSDLGHLAAVSALNSANLKAQDIDLILACTLSPDYYFPGIGVLIQNKLECKAPAMDIRGQCSGFSWAISTAHAMIQSGQAKKVLIVGAEIHSRLIEFSNRGRNVSVLFGDGAGAMILGAQSESEKATATNKVSGVIDNMMGSDGSFAEVLATTRPGMDGSDSFLTVKETEEKAFLPIMDGRLVFKHAVSKMTKAVEQLLERNNLQSTDIDLLVAHQANLRIANMVREKLKLPPEKAFNNIQKYGNTTSASLPIALHEAQQQGVLKSGQLLVTVAFGSGFTWGANLIRV